MKKYFGAKSWFYPLPVLIVGTYDENGVPDAMNAAWGGLYDEDKVVLCLSEGHKTYKNILARKAFTVSFADERNVVASDYVGIVSANNTPDKMEKSGFTAVKGEYADAPVINELPVVFECELLRVTDEGNIIGKVLNVGVDENVLNEKGVIDMTKFRPIIYEPAGHGYYSFGEKVGCAFSDGEKLK